MSYIRTKEYRQKMSRLLKGKKKPYLSKILKAKGIKPPSTKGIKLSEEHKEKIRQARIRYFDKIGRKQHRTYKHIQTSQYYQWRQKVFLRDNYTCQHCNISGCRLHAHHIKNWKEYPAIRYRLDNGKTLCVDCHRQTSNYGNKKVS